MTIKNKTKTTSIIAITFFAALMLVPAGMNTNAFATPTFEEDFTGTHTWTEADDTYIDADTVTNNRLDFDMQRDNTNDASSVPLGVTITGDYVLRYEITFTTLTVGYQDLIWVGLSDSDSSTSQTGNGDFLGLRTQYESTNKWFSLAIADGSNMSGNDGHDTLFSIATDTKYYAEHVFDDTANTFDVTYYSDSDYTTSVQTKSLSASGTYTLDELRVGNADDSSGGGSMVGYIENIKVWDGITQVTTTPYTPTNLIATSENSQITLTWIAPAFEGASAITDYKIEYGNGTAWIVFNDGISTVTNGIVTGLTNGQQYSFRVSAENSEGFGPVSDTAVATPNITIQELQTQILAINATINQQQEDIDYLYEIWEQVRDTIINWLAVRP